MRIAVMGACAMACASGNPGATTHVPAIDTLPNGAIRVRNTGPTAWADTNGWKLVLERTIAPGDGEPGALTQPSAVVIDAVGRVYVLDNRPATIKVFAPDGVFLRSIGREGGGPGEFRPYGMIYAIGDTIVQQDPRQARATVFHNNGSFVRQFPSRCCESQRVITFRDGTIPIPGRLGTGQRGLVRVNLDGTAHDSLPFPIGPEERRWIWQQGDQRMGQGIPFQPGLEWGLTPDAQLIYGTQDAMRFVVSQHAGDSLRVFEANKTPHTIPDSIRQEALETVIRNDDRWRGIARLEDIPTTYPAWTSLAVDGHGHLWVLTPGNNGIDDQWIVFSPEGVQLGAVPAPFTELYGTFWGADRIYVVTDDVKGMPGIRVYRIDRTRPRQ